MDYRFWQKDSSRDRKTVHKWQVWFDYFRMSDASKIYHVSYEQINRLWVVNLPIV